LGPIVVFAPGIPGESVGVPFGPVVVGDEVGLAGNPLAPVVDARACDRSVEDGAVGSPFGPGPFIVAAFAAPASGTLAPP
jgi:hypothetical protein